MKKILIGVVMSTEINRKLLNDTDNVLYKTTEKLFSKIQNIRNNITNVNSKNMDMYNTRFNLTENYLLIFLAASSAVKREDKNITMEDVERILKEENNEEKM